jgi:hypothetical protein
VTKVEFSVYQGSYYYGITTLAGFNLSLDFSCSSGDALRCNLPHESRCTSDNP